MPDPLLIEREGPVALLTLNRPEKLNAYTVPMGEAVVAAFREIGVDETIRAVIVTGAGRGFCSGVDLDALKAPPESTSPLPRIGEEDFVRTLPQELLDLEVLHHRAHAEPAHRNRCLPAKTWARRAALRLLLRDSNGAKRVDLGPR